MAILIYKVISGKMATRLWILFCLSVGVCTGYESYFPVSNIHMTIPTHTEIIDQLKGVPIYRFSMNHFPNNTRVNKLSCRFAFEEKRDSIFTIDEYSGDIFLGTEFQAQTNPVRKTIKITCSNDKMTTRVSLNVAPIKVQSKKSFCQHNLETMCFWDSAVYSIVETDSQDNITKPIPVVDIGHVSNLAFMRICPDLKLDYTVGNATEYLHIHGNTLQTSGKKALDRDSLEPGQFLDFQLNCKVEIEFNAKPVTFSKVIRLNILDKNDNYPEKHNGVNRFNVVDPNYTKDAETNLWLLYTDKDMVATNKLHIDIVNDTFGVFRLQTVEFPNEDEGGDQGNKNSLQSALTHIRLLFANSGTLRKSPYCVTIRALDIGYIYESNKNMTDELLCLEADMKKIHPQLEPVPAPLIGNQERKTDQKSQKYIETINSEEMATRRMIQKIAFPTGVKVYRTAQNYTRVAQPDNMVNISKVAVRFRVQSDPTNSIGITKYGGIIYVRNNLALHKTNAKRFSLEISLNNRTETILIEILDSINGSSCQVDKAQTRLASCAEQRKNQCEKYCGVGVNGGHCQWRHNNQSFLTSKYGTCSPDLDTCPDKFCDPLEEQAQHNKVYLCPQDCTDRAVGSASQTHTKIGINSATRDCICDSVGSCSCGHEDKDLDQPKNRRGPKERQNDTISKSKTMQMGPKCGIVCWGLVVTCPLLIIVIAVIAWLSRYNYALKLKHRRMMEKTNLDSLGGGENGAPLPLMALNNPFMFKSDSDSKWEFPRSRLELDSILGEGEFGKVVRGFATDIDNRIGVTTVAVKMLKTGAHSVELAALMSEFQLLQEVSHPNVIRLLGACTQGDTPLLIIEYCQHGSLRNYLRLSRKVECAGIDYPDGVDAVTVKDILSFAWQICKGMAYLTDNKLVHRDLAARNVLLAEGKVCKVSDFGLTRDVYEDDAYLKRSKDRVPVKWMAPESLADHVYTNRSDVWAFGVLSWELITLGASPYPGVPPQNLYHLLKQGYRMERPDNCSEEIFSIVRSCWADDPIGRPSFKVLAAQFEKLLGNNAKYLELEQNAISNPLYCADNDQELPHIETELDEDGLDHLWYPPNRNSLELAEAELDNINGFNRDSSKLKLLEDNSLGQQMGYDIPRPLIEAKTIEQKLRYENEVLAASMKKSESVNQTRNAYINDSMNPSRANKQSTRDVILDNGYEIPRPIKAYVDMGKHSQSLDNCNNSAVYYKTVEKNNRNIANNLDSKSIDKNLSKDLAFKFMGLLNVSADTTSSTNE